MTAVEIDRLTERVRYDEYERPRALSPEEPLHALPAAPLCLKLPNPGCR
jgi:hypothetical protein